MANDIINYLEQTLKLVKNKRILFRYKEKINLSRNSIASIFNSNYQTFRFYYSDDIEYIGIGRCLEYNIYSKEDLEKLKINKLEIHSFGKNKNQDLKFFGGVAFNIKANLKEPWDGIPPGLFIIPEILITKQRSHYFISYHCILDKNTDIEKIINNYDSIINHLHNNSQNKNHLKFQKDYPDKKEYIKIFNTLTDSINNKLVSKVVLSRTKIYSVSNKCILKRDQANCTNFHIDLMNNRRFIGSTPEKIIEVTNKDFYTHAIAGTLRKNQNNIDLKKFLANRKELSEHKYVIKDLIKKLAKFSDDIIFSKIPDILELEHLYHLNTPIKGILRKKTHILDLLYHLYPTPAVLGTPSEQALNLIIKNEPFDRGWYSGCIGWFDLNGNGRFDVSIRSAFQKNNKLYFYAGSGLIDNADESYEWEETQTKFQHLLSLIN